ncbi:fasciclin domain-containing protein [Cytophagales bacterium LB-30]|uniref:Fasciclin domain-containing protein n=1 Tax=Shiella aurantiaca TaxID=3058365 RepID=A0ABT8F4J9_9BACT|nr:fasciclin domain-containing protein [Shiella aurantiaca]MDN4165308.1 fasciclin domain-containing protein [Shiella aurantiaca]
MKHTNYFSNASRAFALLTIAGSSLFFASCDKEDEDPAPTMTVMEIIEETAGLDSLEKYLNTYPDLVALFEGSAEYTVFAPNNTAFAGLLATPGFPSDIRDINPDIVKGVLTYHAVSGTTLSGDLTSGSSLTSAQGEAIGVTVSAGVVTLQTGSSNANIDVLEADLRATNGVVHIVESVMIPPSVGATLTPILGTNAGTLLLGAPFSILAQGIAKADVFAAENGLATLTSILAGANAHTVFAPTNATFEAGSITAATFTGQQWYGIIANHAVLSTVLPDDLTTGATFDTAAGGQLLIFNNTAAIPAQNGVGIYIDGDGDVNLADQTTYTNFDAEVALPNAAINSNGRVHVIAGVLAPGS